MSGGGFRSVAWASAITLVESSEQCDGATPSFGQVLGVDGDALRVVVMIWGPAARKFFRECVALANDDRDIDLYHWSSTRFSRAWFDSLSVLVARGRAKVSAAAAASDWPKRIRDMQHIDVEDLD